MSEAMDDKKLAELAKELARNVKSQDDLADLSRKLLKMTVKTALNTELEVHLGYPKNSVSGHGIRNRRNGYS